MSKIMYIVKMIVGDENHLYDTVNTTMPAPRTILETENLEEAKKVQSETPIEWIDKESGVYAEAVILKEIDGEEVVGWIN